MNGSTPCSMGQGSNGPCECASCVRVRVRVRVGAVLAGALEGACGVRGWWDRVALVWILGLFWHY
jgi:hypothetical protein